MTQTSQTSQTTSTAHSLTQLEALATHLLAVIEATAAELLADIAARAALPEADRGPTPDRDRVLPALARELRHTIQLNQHLRTPPRPMPTKAELDRLERRRNRIQSHANRIIKAEADPQTHSHLSRHILERLDSHDLTHTIDTQPVPETAIRLCQNLGLAQNTNNWPQDLQQTLQTITQPA
jgi:hypothetical protein